jgi:hypothetical protein
MERGILPPGISIFSPGKVSVPRQARRLPLLSNLLVASPLENLDALSFLRLQFQTGARIISGSRLLSRLQRSNVARALKSAYEPAPVE